ncbi:MAG: acyl-ACP desaturase [Streptomyces sp.]|nr:acyl-ACP desaturase [Streptomyces sp.]
MHVHVLSELEPVVEENLNRHLALAKEWFPHAYVPWSCGADFDGPLGGRAWRPADSALPAAARTALVVNLLTEDNLPSYHRQIATLFGRDGAWGTWVHRWTAEEGRHGTAIRDYLLTTRGVDPCALERSRMAHMGQGFTSPHEDDPVHAIAYVALQELATRISHRNTGRISGDPRCEALLTRIAADENLHMVFYRNLLGALLEITPDRTLPALRDVVADFRMPGHGLDNFARMSRDLAYAGVYDLRIHHDEVLLPLLRHTGVLHRTGLTGEAARAQDDLGAFLARLDTAATRFVTRREARTTG